MRNAETTKGRIKYKKGGVKKLNTGEGSAGTGRTSETKSNETEKLTEHVPKHRKPEQETEFGHYLAGIIDGRGEISEEAITIGLEVKDIQLAYYIKKRIGYGRVKKEEEGVKIKITGKEGIKKVIKTINGKIRTERIKEEIKKNIE